MLDIQRRMENSIKEKDGELYVSSRAIAKEFNKNHNMVLRDIRKKISDLKETGEKGVYKFAQSEYKNKQGKKQPEFLLNRSAFMLIVMSYEGKKALATQVKYTNAFEAMRSFIRNRMQSKMEYPEMTAAIHDAHEDPRFYHYSVEADMINRIVTGMTAKQLRVHRNIPDKDLMRDYLTSEEIFYIRKLQNYNTILIEDGEDYKSRKPHLIQYFNRLKKKQMALAS